MKETNEEEIIELIRTFGRETFEIKEEHLKLLREVYIDWWDCEFGAPCIDPKRPYGNSDVYGDIGEILGIQPTLVKEGEKIFSEKQEEIMEKLHAETKTALQIILATGKFEVGLYECPSYHTKTWRKTK